MAEYQIDMRDVRFVLYEQLGLEDLAKLPRYAEQEHGREIYDIVLDEAYKLAREKIGPISESGDKDGCRYEDGQVKMPPGYKEAYDFYSENMWIAPTADPAFGGQGLPDVLGACIAEMFTGANCAFMITQGLTVGAGNLIYDFGTEEQKALYLEKMYSGKWAGTMCLTEEGAGSDVGASRTKAKKVGDHYLIEGSKVFISSGDQDLTENIIHMVLARTEGAPKGVKGLSLFIVPKMSVNPDGSIGEWNGVRCPKIEEKMGIHGSPTCVLDFGTDGTPCVGYLLGEEFEGIKIMFHMMNEARLYVGIQGESLGNLAYLHALDFAKERLQFQHFAKMGDPEAPKVAIVEHPDVRRMLMFGRAYGEAMRALIYWTAKMSDLGKYSADKNERTTSFLLTELLTPICKAWCSDMGFRVAETSLQVYGGYGYISEYPAEQILRDSKIASIYEGTNGIQALDLLGRKVAGKGGLRFMHLLQIINGWVGANKDHPTLGDLVKAVDDAKNKLAEVTFGFQVAFKKAPALALTAAVPYLYMFGDVLGAFLLAQQAVIADEKLNGMSSAAEAAGDRAALRELAKDNPEIQFYFNKIQTASFFISRILPNIESYLKVIKTKDNSVMDVVL